MPYQAKPVDHSCAHVVTRRSFLIHAAMTVAGLSVGASLLPKSPVANAELHAPTNLQLLGRIPPLFCIAYIDPDISSHQGQEATIAKYPLTLVPQDMRRSQIAWRDRIQELNPNIRMLSYQMVIEETPIPGPGHGRMRQVNNSWCTYPGGFHPTVRSGSGRSLRIFDPRNPEWQDGFVDACRATLSSHPYAGLFLDQCTVYDKAHPFPSVREEMRQALQMTILRIRSEFPQALIIGNSSYDWKGLNGELNEGRPQTMAKEFKAVDGHAQPRTELYNTVLRRADDIETAKREMALAHSFGAFYCAAVDYQHVLWFDIFDQVIAQYQ